MAEFLKLNIDKRAFDSVFEDLPNVTKKATATTLNKVGRKANTAAKKEITQNYNIKARSLKIGKLVRLKRADARRNKSTFSIIIRKAGRGLLKFGAKQVAGGVAVKVKRSPKLIRGAFISVWRKGGTNKWVFLRDKGLGTYTRGRSKRIKRRALFGPSIAALYGSRRVKKVIDKTIDNLFQPTLNEEFNRQFEKRR